MLGDPEDQLRNEMGPELTKRRTENDRGSLLAITAERRTHMGRALVDAQYCYLTTRGRVSGNPHTIEIWFALQGDTLYMMAGDGARADWVRNLVRTPEVSVRIEDRHFRGQARVVEAASPEDALARRLLVAKYRPGYAGDLSDWERNGLPVAVSLDETEASVGGG